MPNGRHCSPCCLPRSRQPAGQTTTTGESSTASCGFIAPERRGATCRRSATAPLARCRAGFIGGAKPACGLRSGRRCRPPPRPAAPSTGPCTLSMPPSCAPISHQHAAGARWVGEKEGTSPQERAAAEALGRSQGGFSTKIHLRAEGQGRPMAITLTGGERHEQTALVEILDAGAVRRPGPGRPRLRPRRLVGDKAYAGRPVRTHLRRRGIQPVIPSKTGQPRNPFFDRQAYRLRNRVERLINRLKQFRRIATRYEKRAVNDLAMIVIGAILLWL